MSLNENLEKLSNACGVTGRESQVRELMIKLMKPYVDEITVDRLENVIAVKQGKAKATKNHACSPHGRSRLNGKNHHQRRLSTVHKNGRHRRPHPASPKSSRLTPKKAPTQALSGQNRHTSKKKKNAENS